MLRRDIAAIGLPPPAWKLCGISQASSTGDRKPTHKATALWQSRIEETGREADIIREAIRRIEQC